jgi:transcriptional regulator with XRE-family HTH domain
MDYGKRIKQLREKAGMTQADLGKALGVTHSAISLIESGDRGLNVETADKIAQALGVSLVELITENK